MRLAVLAALALAALPAGDASAAPRATTTVRVTVDRDGPGAQPARTLRLTCGRRTRAPGCRTLRRLPREALAAPDPGAICTQVYGGPQTARIIGRVDGRRVDAAFHRADGCGIARWELAAPVFALVPRAAAPASVRPATYGPRHRVRAPDAGWM
jgi:hypothetical protein